MKQLCTIVLVFLSSVIYSKDSFDFHYTSDYPKILALTKQDTSKLYFPVLFKRYEAGDSTLTDYEILALQIGYTDNDNYWPYQDIDLERKIWDLNERGKYKLAVKSCDKLLKSNPFNILACREKWWALQELKRFDESNIYLQKFFQIVKSDLATGDGTSYESSWFVISPADGQWLIRMVFKGTICFMGSGHDKDGNFHDILGYKAKTEDGDKTKDEDCRHMFFNIEHASMELLT